MRSEQGDRPAVGDGPTPASKQGADVTTLLRGLAVLEAVVRLTGPSTPKEIAAATNLDRSIVQRSLRTLVRAGYLRRMSRGDYSIGPAALSLGWQLTRSNGLAEVSMPALERLRHTTGETVNIAVLDHCDIAYVGRVQAPRLITVNVNIGTRLPAFCTALGRAIVAFLPKDTARELLESSHLKMFTAKTHTNINQLEKDLAKVRADGYAIVDQELEPTLRAIAAPIFDAAGHPIAAINISVTTNYTLKALRDLAPSLMTATDEVSVILGCRRDARVGDPVDLDQTRQATL
jgi:IclR family pca regulon transcriptional regulator